jgi:hypothetical protein
MWSWSNLLRFLRLSFFSRYMLGSDNARASLPDRLTYFRATCHHTYTTEKSDTVNFATPLLTNFGGLVLKNRKLKIVASFRSDSIR